MKPLNSSLLLASLLAGLAGCASAHDASHAGGIASRASKAVQAPFDIVHTRISTEGNIAIFHMAVSGTAGAARPARSGRLAGSAVFSYVWPTSMDPSVVGFEPKAGILAFAVTAHPDFDDTPLFDENGDGDPANDGAGWHSHWVVLGEDAACAGGLKVRDVSPGQDLLPDTAPGLPIALDSPGMSPLIAGSTVRITVPVAGAENVNFDAVAARLKVNAEGKAPLLCVTGTYKVASGKLTLPGVVVKQAK